MARPAPRQINEKETFERLVAWLVTKIEQDRISSLTVGVSGTDSLLSFLACYEAFKILGKPERALAINFMHPGPKPPAGQGPVCTASDKNWFDREIMPWLKQRAPGAAFLTDSSLPFSDEHRRWGALFSLALEKTAAYKGGGHRYIAGTRNRSEKMLGTYSLFSRNPQIQPIEHLYKTEVLALCRYLGVPEIALEKSREIDCDCGRFDVQAHYMDELDAFLMVEAGDLAPKYLDTIKPEILTAVQGFYAEERSHNAFREEIPQKPALSHLSLKGADIETALNGVRDAALHAKILTPRAQSGRILAHVLPGLLEDKNAAAAHEIVSAAPSFPASLRAEGFALMGAPGLSPAQLKDMSAPLFGPESLSLDEGTLRLLAQTSGRAGQYAFSFPAKRFVSQNFNGGPSLLERAGYERKQRANDKRDPSLPPSNPMRDELGTGFVWKNETLYSEQRRAYVLFADHTPGQEVALLIRNSSYFFGRDRLPEPVYISWEPLSGERLEVLTANEVANPAFFTPWQDILKATAPLSPEERLIRAAHALDIMDDIDLKFSLWLKSRGGSPPLRSPHAAALKDTFNQEGGLSHLREFLRTALKERIDAEKPGSPLYLAQIAKGAAPWQPENVQPVTTDLLAALKEFQEGKRVREENIRKLFAPQAGAPRQLALLSAPDGDFPVRLEI